LGGRRERFALRWTVGVGSQPSRKILLPFRFLIHRRADSCTRGFTDYRFLFFK